MPKRKTERERAGRKEFYVFYGIWKMQDLDTQSSHSSLVIFHLKKTKEESSLSSLSSLVIFVSSLEFSCKKRDFMRKMVHIYFPFVLIEVPNII